MYVFNPQICVSYNLRKLYYEVYRYVFNPQICVSYNCKRSQQHHLPNNAKKLRTAINSKSHESAHAVFMSHYLQIVC